ncbi:MAG: FGGY family carbohydrate kinase [Rhodospirillales bacterium]|nr:FGGY family carbohydrate kinase [Rhodospirillales bacterium]
MGGRNIVIGVDQGTTNTKVVAVDDSGKMIAEASRPIETRAPQPSWVEQDPDAMLENVVGCVRDVLDKTGRSAGDATGLGIANQTETLIVWDRKTGKPVLPAIVWQCRRGQEQIESVRNGGNAESIRQRTGLDLDPTFTAPKLKWVCENRPEIARGLRNGDHLFGTVDCWLIWKLTGGAVYATEPGNASRTMLLDINTLAWDPGLRDLFDLSIAEMPQLRRSSGPFGETDAEFFGAPITISAALGDQQASLFGHGCFDENQRKVTYGTGAFVWMNAGKRADIPAADGLIRTVAWHLDDPCYALEGFVMSAGAALDWLADHIGIFAGGPGVVAEAQEAKASDGVYLVPAFQGLASPWWRPDVRGGLIGMTEATTSGHICHAGLEAICYQIRTIMDVVAGSLGHGIEAVSADGGPTKSAYLMQLQADILQRPVAPAIHESVTPYGVALMAGLGFGLWEDLGHLRRIIPAPAIVRPDPASASRWDDGYGGWRAATDALLNLYGSNKL